LRIIIEASMKVSPVIVQANNRYSSLPEPISR
jgi:hypothetical protein